MSSVDGQKYLSWHNSSGEETQSKRQFLVHDVTLRDGEQQAGVVFSPQDKIEIALALDGLGVDRIEAGRVDVGEEELESLRTLTSLGLKAEIWAVARASADDIKKAADVGVDGVGIVILASDRYLAASSAKIEDVIHSALIAAEEARATGIKTTLLVADSSRLPIESLRSVLTATSASWLYDGVALMDSYGVLTPQGAANLVASSRNYTDLPIEIHAHNDFGLGVANALAALKAGASVVHASVIGLGERVGNTALEELAVAASVLCGFQHNLRLAELMKTTDLVQRLSGVTVASNKPIVGESYGQIESSFVAAEYRKLVRTGSDRRSMFPILPEIFGGADIEIVVGKFSGPANIDHILAAENIRLDEPGKAELLRIAKKEATRKHRLLVSSEIRALAAEIAAKRLDWID